MIPWKFGNIAVDYLGLNDRGALKFDCYIFNIMAERVTALLPFNVPREITPKGELSFNSGDIITVVDKGAETGWWKGVCNGVEGLFPNCLTAPVVATVATAAKRSFFGRGIVVDAFVDGKSQTVPVGTGLLVLALTPERTDFICARWNLTSPPPTTTPRVSELLMVPVESVATDIVLALYSYSASDVSDLPLERGDIIAIRRRWNDSWWEGTLVANSNTVPPTRPSPTRKVHGIFPSTFVVQNHASPAPTSAAVPLPFAPHPPLCTLCVQPMVRTAGESRYPVSPATLAPPDAVCVRCAERMAVVDRVQGNMQAWRAGGKKGPLELFGGTQTLWSDLPR